MEINSQSPAYFNQQTSVLKQDAQSRAQNIFPEPAPTEAMAPRQASPEESQQKANLEANLRKLNQQLNQRMDMDQGEDGLDKYTDQPSKRAQQALAAYEAVEKPSQKVSVDALI
jgi:hypothetical protein